MTATQNLALPFIEASQAQKHVTHNEALRILDAAIHIGVLDVTRTVPPTSPAEGDRHIVGASATGAWAGADDQIATWEDGAWRFLSPNIGWCAWSSDDEILFVWDGALWRDLRDLLLSFGNISTLGINDTANTTNRLSLQSNAALFHAQPVADGGTGDMRFQIAKEGTANTASVVFSNNYSGRAEFGLAGSDAFALKVSNDGASWKDALSFDPASAQCTLKGGLALSGVLSPPQLTTNENDYAPSGLELAAVLKLNAASACQISGLGGGVDGRILVVLNSGSQTITLADESALSSSANRFSLSAPISLSAKQAALLRYDETAARWFALARPPSLAGVPADLDFVLAELAMADADNANIAQFLGASGNRFADSFDALTYVDVGGATNLNSSVAGLLKPTSGSSGDQTATHVAATTGGHTVSANSEASSGFAGWKAFDKVTGGAGGANTWHTNALATGWLQYQFSSARVIGSYTIRSANGYPARAPKTWTLQGSNTGAFAGEQVVIDTQADVTSWISTGEVKTFTVTSPGSYAYYRLNITASNGDASYLAIDEMTLVSSAATYDLAVTSTAFVAASVPATMRVVVKAKFIDSVTLGTDLKVSVSRDGGTTWTYAAMNDRFTVSSIHVLESDDISVTGQPSGSSVKWRVETFNGKMIELHDIYVYWS